MQILKKDLYRARYAIIAVILYFVVMELVFGMTCPLKAITGIDCPACGLSRAGIALLTGKFILAYQYNRTIYLWVPLIIIFFVDRYLKKFIIKPFPVLFIIVCILTMVNYILNFII